MVTVLLTVVPVIVDICSFTNQTGGATSPVKGASLAELAPHLRCFPAEEAAQSVGHDSNTENRSARSTGYSPRAFLKLPQILYDPPRVRRMHQPLDKGSRHREIG